MFALMRDNLKILSAFVKTSADKYKDNFYLLMMLNSIVLILLLLAMLLTPSAMFFQIRYALSIIVSYTLRFHLLLILVFLILLIKPLFRFLKIIKLGTWIILGIILIVGVYQFWFVAPFTHRVYFDEDIYTNIAANIATQGKALKPNFGTPTECYEGEYNKDPSGMPAFVSVFYSLFGVSEYLASRITVIVCLLSVFLVFLIAYLLFGNELLSLFAAFMFVLLPENIIWAPTVAAEPYFVFFAALTLLGITLYTKVWDNKVLLFSLLCLAYAAQVRPEGILLLLVIEVFLFFSACNFEEKLSDRGFVASWVLFFILLLPQLFTFAVFRNMSWGASGVPMFSLAHFPNNFRTNYLYFFENTRTPLLISVLAFLGVLTFKKHIRDKMLLGLVFLVFFSVFLFFYAGSYNFGTDVRFSLILNIPLVIFAALGINLLNSIVFKRSNKIAVSVIWIVLLVFSYRAVYSSIPVAEEAIHSRVSHDYMVELLRELPKNSYMLSYDPCIVVINGRKGAQSFYAARKEVVEKMFSETDHVYFYKDIWSQIPPYKDQWKEFLKGFDLELVKGLPFRELSFDLYRMRLKE